MEEMADRYADRAVRSVFLYTREAHPGENYRHHTSMDDKRHHALAFKKECKVRRQILLDDVEGTAHSAYGMLPNMTWIMSRGGFIQYKSAWTHPADVEDALGQALHGLENRSEEGLMPYYSERVTWANRDTGYFRFGLERAGPQAVTDFFGEPGAAPKPRPKLAPGAFSAVEE